ncbi:GAF domain-containing protein, partial [bacterium]|nr:GAF domain-containing protein [bacterium]
MTTTPLTKEQLENRLLALHEASLELVREMSIDTLIEKIASIAMEQVNASYAAVGILDAEGRLEKFIPMGMTREEMDQISHPPVGKGLIGELMHTKDSIRVAEIKSDPRSSGFPAFHPKMTSFLGVPIYQGQQQLGQLYLTDKRSGGEFTAEDQQIIEMLAAYAAISISNARMYKEMITRDRALTRRNENLALLNTMASTMSTSDDIDLIVRQSLGQLLSYLRLEVGEVFLRREDSELLQMVHHQGMLIERLWKKDQVLIGEDIVG